MSTSLLVAAGGALGALLRYAVSGLALRVLGSSFPWGTLVVNLSGCLLIGLAWGFAEESGLSPAVRIFFMTGVLGAYTTFSTFGIETVNLFRDGALGLVLVNVLASNFVGFAAVAAGLFIARAAA